MLDKYTKPCIMNSVDASKQTTNLKQKGNTKVNAVTSLVEELAYELVPTSDQQILRIDNLLNQ